MERNNKLLIFSFIALNLFQWISIVEFKYGIPNIVKYVFSVFVLLTIIYYRVLNPLKPNHYGLFYPIILFFVLWSMILVLFSILRFDSLFYIQKIFGDPYFLIPYILPILLLFTKFKIKFLKLYFHYSFIFLIPALFFQIFIIVTGPDQGRSTEQINLITIFDLGSCFLLLTAHISKKTYISYFVLLYIFLMIFLFSYYGRRGVIFEYMLLLFSMVLIRLRSPFLVINDRMRMYFAGLIFIILILTYGNILLFSSYAFQRGLNKEAVEESRGLVVRDFFYDFNSTSDWIFGRGLEGMVLRSYYGDNASANFIENGFLTLVLKGGLLYMIPVVIILLSAGYLGIYKSNNDLVKALASMLIIYVVMLIYFNLPVFSTKYIFTWISVTVCFNPEIRKLNNKEIYTAIIS